MSVCLLSLRCRHVRSLYQFWKPAVFPCVEPLFFLLIQTNPDDGCKAVCVPTTKADLLLLDSSPSCSLLKGRDRDGFPVYQEKFVRECIRKFPYADATLLQQLVRSIAPVEIVSPRERYRWRRTGRPAARRKTFCSRRVTTPRRCRC